jgi:hypothetical protein
VVFGDQLRLAGQQASGPIAPLDDTLTDAVDHPAVDAAQAYPGPRLEICRTDDMMFIDDPSFLA